MLVVGYYWGIDPMFSDIHRIRLRSRFNELFSQSRSVADSRSIVWTTQEDDEQIGWFKVRDLIRERELISSNRDRMLIKSDGGAIGYSEYFRIGSLILLRSTRDGAAISPHLLGARKMGYLAVVMVFFALRVVG
jgi:putative transposase